MNLPENLLGYGQIQEKWLEVLHQEIVTIWVITTIMLKLSSQWSKFCYVKLRMNSVTSNMDLNDIF